MVKQFPDICINGETEESLKNGAAQIVSLVKPAWKNEDFDQTYVDAGSKTQNVEEWRVIWYSKIISGKISKVLENKTLT